MKRFASLVILSLAAAPAAAQDISLSQILVEGQGWHTDNNVVQELLRNRSGVVAANGFQYMIDDVGRQLVALHKDGKRVQMAETKQLGLTRPSGMTLWPDGRTLVVGDAEGKHLWAFRIEKNGSLSCGEGYYTLRVGPGMTASGVTALTVDCKGLLYACTPLGVQVFDPTGRLCGVLLKPDDKTPTAIAFGGLGRDTLYVLEGENSYGRNTQAKGVNKP